MRTIAWLSEKGGPGKTTCAVNTAVALAKSGLRVLFVDADQQANATAVLAGGPGAPGPTTFDLLTGDADALEAARPSATPGLDLVPADGHLANANLLLAAELGRERRLRDAMAAAEGRYDYVVLDTSPSRSLVNVNVLNYVAEVYCPVDPGIFALMGLAQLRETVAGVVKHLDNPGLRIAGVVVNRAQRDNLSRDLEAQVRGAFGATVLATRIPSAVAVGEAHARFSSVLDYAPGSPAAKAFVKLTAEITGHGADIGVGGGGGGHAEADGPAGGKPRARKRTA